jgi:hypothetical protein
MGLSVRVLGVEFRQGEEVLRLGTDHALRDTRTELEDLPANVLQEGIRGPAANGHDRELWHWPWLLLIGWSVCRCQGGRNQAHLCQYVWLLLGAG